MKYVAAIEKRGNGKCTYCEYEDDSEHTLFHCHKWDDERNDLQEKINTKLRMENLVKKVLSSEENWEVVKESMTKTIG